jgi:hypothetical protein
MLLSEPLKEIKNNTYIELKFIVLPVGIVPAAQQE